MRKGDAFFNHTNTTGCHVGSNHNGTLAGLEFVQDPISFILGFVAMNSYKLSAKCINKQKQILTQCWPSILTKVPSNFVSNALSSCKEQDLVLLVVHNLFKVFDHSFSLFRFGNNFNNLSDTLICRKVHGSNIDLNKVFEEI